MQTQTHVLLALALLSKKDAPKRNLAIFVGALIPDAFIYVAWIIYMFMGKTQSEIWDVLYFQNPTQFFDALFNSIPLYLTIAGIGFISARRTIGRGKLLSQCVMVFGLAA